MRPMQWETAGPEDEKGVFAQPDRPIYSLSTTSELLGIDARTLMTYEQRAMVTPKRTVSNRRRYSQRDLVRLNAILTLTREHGVNLAGVRHIIDLVRTLHVHGVQPPEALRSVSASLVDGPPPRRVRA
jgi:DNA-binding transcriptional MerR regulator